jgi:hypothetical protein
MTETAIDQAEPGADVRSTVGRDEGDWFLAEVLSALDDGFELEKYLIARRHGLSHDEVVWQCKDTNFWLYVEARGYGASETEILESRALGLDQGHYSKALRHGVNHAEYLAVMHRLSPVKGNDLMNRRGHAAARRLMSYVGCLEAGATSEEILDVFGRHVDLDSCYEQLVRGEDHEHAVRRDERSRSPL